MGGQAELSGPDLTKGVPFASVSDGGMLLGQANGEAVLLVRRGEQMYAVGATCSHYSGPLAEGLLVRDEIRCPWHHACFSLKTGEALAAPALNPIPCYRVERRGELVVLGAKIDPPQKDLPTTVLPASVVIVGAGAAGNAAAEMLRREGYPGKIVLIGAEDALPVDRPNLSKDYLAGSAPEEWIPLRSRDFYKEQGIELRLGQRVTALDTKTRKLTLSDGTSLPYGALLLATGAAVNQLSIPGADGANVHYLRSLADSRAIIAKLGQSKRAVVIGASFIGLEVAASLRQRKLEVHVVGPETRPLERVLGPELGDFVRALHEEHGVTFHLGCKPASIDARGVTLDDGTVVPADLVVVGVGVHPELALAEQAGLTIDRGVVVSEYLETSAPAVYAAGDIARWPDPHSGGKIRVEHWVVAERQGQVAARNILGKRERFRAVPFFWSQHYDVQVTYLGHAEKWDAIEIAGSLKDKSCLVAYRAGGKIVAMASIFRDQESLRAEAAMERGDHKALEKLLADARA